MDNLILNLSCDWDGCKKRFNKANDLYYHCRKTHIRKEMTKCLWKDCEMISSSRCNLTNHLLVHIPVVNGVCYICDRSFKWRCDFKRHVKGHSNSQNRFNEAVSILFYSGFER